MPRGSPHSQVIGISQLITTGNVTKFNIRGEPQTPHPAPPKEAPYLQENGWISALLVSVSCSLIF